MFGCRCSGTDCLRLWLFAFASAPIRANAVWLITANCHPAEKEERHPLLLPARRPTVRLCGKSRPSLPSECLVLALGSILVNSPASQFSAMVSSNHQRLVAPLWAPLGTFSAPAEMSVRCESASEPCHTDGLGQPSSDRVIPWS